LNRINRKSFLKKSGISFSALLMGIITNKLQAADFPSEHFPQETFIDNQDPDL